MRLWLTALLLESPSWQLLHQAGVDGAADGVVEGAGVAAGAAVDDVSLVEEVLVDGVVLDEPPRLSVL